MAKSEAQTLQELANKNAIELQKMINSANKLNMDFNAAEAEKARKFDSAEAATAREFNAAEAEKARNWQRYMSQNSHQMEVADLKKAGLNPVLSANSGATSYTTSSANANNASGPAGSANLESGAGAMSSLYSGVINALTGLSNAQTSASATLRAAQLSSDASRFSAAQSAAATKYAADQNLAASKYAADMSYKTQMDKPATNLAGLADKYGSKIIKTPAFQSLAKKFGVKTLDKALQIGSKIRNNAKKRGLDYDFSGNNTKLIDKGLKALGYNNLNALSFSQLDKLRNAFMYTFAYTSGGYLDNSNIVKVFLNKK